MSLFLVLPFYILAPFTSAGQSQFERQFSFAGANVELYDAAPIANTGFFLCGVSFGQPWQSFVVRTNMSGDTLWTRRMSTRQYMARPLQDGGIIMAGLEVTRLAADGLPLWSKTYDNGGAGSVHQTFDGGFILTGSNLFNSILKIDAAGTPQWKRFYDVVNNTHDVRPTSGGGYVILGSTTSAGAGGSDMVLILTDWEGEVLWFRTFGGAGTESPINVEQTADGGFAILGTTDSFGAGNQDLYLVRTDANGNLLWSRTMGGPDNDVASSLHVLANGGYLLAGSTASWGEPYRQYALNVSADGELNWARTYGSFGGTWRTVARPINAGGYMVCGMVDGQNSVQFARTNASGNSGCDDVTDTQVGTPATITTTPEGLSFPGPPSASSVSVNSSQGCTVTAPCLTTGMDRPAHRDGAFTLHPNPTNGPVQLHLNASVTDAHVTLVDARGAVTMDLTLAGGATHMIDLSGHAAGLYSIRVVQDGRVQVVSLVRE